VSLLWVQGCWPWKAVYNNNYQVWWYMPVVSALGTLRQEDRVQGQPEAGCRRLLALILATREAEIRRITV
jgi:hypothetical protein